MLICVDLLVFAYNGTNVICHQKLNIFLSTCSNTKGERLVCITSLYNYVTSLVIYEFI